MHVVKSEETLSQFGLHTNGGTPDVTIKRFYTRVGHLDPPAYISFSSSSYVSAQSKIDKGVDSLSIMTEYRHFTMVDGWLMSSSKTCILVLVQLIFKPSCDDSLSSTSRARITISNMLAKSEISSVKSSSVNVSLLTFRPK